MKTKAPFVRNPYNYDTNAASDEAGIACPEPTLTQQHFREEADINHIAERFGLTGELPEVKDRPTYGDFSGIFDFQTAQNAVVEAKQQFMTLPAKLRTRFDNNPQKLLDFLDDPDNREEAEFLGILQKRSNEPVAPPPGAPAGKPDRETPTPDGKPPGAPDPKPAT